MRRNSISRRKFVVAAGVSVFAGGSLLTSAPAVADDWLKGAGDDWKNILDAGRKEGKVILAADGPGIPGVAEAFKSDTGIELDILSGQQGVLSTRIDRELASGNLTIDCLLSGGVAFRFLHQKNLVPIKPQLVLPTVTGDQYWSDGKIRWFDNDQQYMLQGSNYVFSAPIVNAKFVDVKTLTSWKDLLKPEFKGKIVVDDPRRPGPGAGASAYLVETFGLNFLKELYSGATFVRDLRQLGEFVARGNYPIGIGSIQMIVERFKKTGAEIVVPSFPDGPGSLVGGYSVLAEMKGAPHPRASQVFINWYASKNGQEAYSRASLEPSARNDVQVAEIPSYVVPKPGLKYFNQYDQDWFENVRPKLQQTFIDELGGR